jgi:hypothetical protein
MRELPGRWKIFKAACIIQMILVILMLVISASGIFYEANIGWRFFETICYGTMMLFLYNGFSLLNDNYPDQALTPQQKRSFNILFLFNFLMIAFLFAKVVAQWRYFSLFTKTRLEGNVNLLVYLPLVIALLIFVLHLIYLAGMYRLRLVITENAHNKIDEGFINGD